jgi:hypothetical protein
VSDLNQRNFERAVSSGYNSLSMLTEAAREREFPNLRNVNTRKLQSIAWDLEAIQTSIRMELNDRLGGASGGMDLG